MSTNFSSHRFSPEYLCRCHGYQRLGNSPVTARKQGGADLVRRAFVAHAARLTPEAGPSPAQQPSASSASLAPAQTTSQPRSSSPSTSTRRAGTAASHGWDLARFAEISLLITFADAWTPAKHVWTHRFRQRLSHGRRGALFLGLAGCTLTLLSHQMPNPRVKCV